MWFRAFNKKDRDSQAARRLSIRPHLEVLEDRCVPSSGPLDPTFGSGGIATSSATANFTPNIEGMALQADGKVLDAGYVTTASGSTQFAVARLTSSGSLDTTFGNGGVVTTKFSGTTGGQAHPVAVCPNTGSGNDGKILLGGGVTGHSSSFALARYNTNGSLDTSFGSKGTVTTTLGQWGFIYALVIQPDGKILAAGSSEQPDPSTGYPRYEFTLARYNANGSLDTSFGSGGVVLTPFGHSHGGGISSDGAIWGMTLQTDGKIVVAGNSSTGTSSEFFTVARYNANGTLDTSFAGTGVVTLPHLRTSNPSDDDEARGVAIQPDGKIVATGWVQPDTIFAASEWALARFNTDGSLDSSFGSGGEVSLAIEGAPVYTYGDNANAIALQADGKIVVAGTHSENGHSIAVGRFNTDGSLDTTFNGTGVLTTQVGTGSYGLALAIQPADGKIVVVGNSSLGVAAVRYLATDPTIGSFTSASNPVTSGSNEALTVSNITDSNPSSSITQVAIYLDSNSDGKLEPGTDTQLGYATQTSPGVWTYTFTVSQTPGTYTLFVQAEDNYSLFSDPSALTLTVQ